MAAKKTKYYMLAGLATMFWDAKQSNPTNTKLMPGEVKALEDTEEVRKKLRAGGLQIVPEDEAQELLAARQELAEAGTAQQQAVSRQAALAAATPVLVTAKETELTKALAEADKKQAATQQALEEAEAKYQATLQELGAAAEAQKKQEEAEQAKKAAADTKKAVAETVKATAESTAKKTENK